MSIADAVKNHSRKWDYGIMIALATALFGSITYIIGSEMSAHNFDAHAHPHIVTQITSNSDQLDRLEANQLLDQAMGIDARLCDDRNNDAYRRELSRLITAWEQLTGKNFPRELLRCI